MQEVSKEHRWQLNCVNCVDEGTKAMLKTKEDKYTSGEEGGGCGGGGGGVWFLLEILHIKFGQLVY